MMLQHKCMLICQCEWLKCFPWTIMPHGHALDSKAWSCGLENVRVTSVNCKLVLPHMNSNWVSVLMGIQIRSRLVLVALKVRIPPSNREEWHCFDNVYIAFKWWVWSKQWWNRRLHNPIQKWYQIHLEITYCRAHSIGSKCFKMHKASLMTKYDSMTPAAQRSHSVFVH